MARTTALKAAIAIVAMVFALPASAADLDVGDGYDGGADASQVIRVHNRGYRHCHWIDGDRVCHRRGVPYAANYGDYDDWYEPYYGGYAYGWGPGIVLGFGGRGYGYRGGWGGRGHGGRR
ncbi:MAG: hypothetical protein K2Q28_16755 [Hyphomicrobium sp.]|nr:hypothetical protein [Hyphomicrobium sp.]